MYRRNYELLIMNYYSLRCRQKRCINTGLLRCARNDEAPQIHSPLITMYNYCITIVPANKLLYNG